MSRGPSILFTRPVTHRSTLCDSYPVKHSHRVLRAPMAARAPTGVHTPTYLPYPVRIAKLLVTPDSIISRGSALCNYSFEHLYPAKPQTVPAGPSPPGKKEVRYGTWESPVDGVVQRWQVRPGDIITAESATKNPAIMIVYVLTPSWIQRLINEFRCCSACSEECTHNVQIHGLCAICGKDMTKCVYSFSRKGLWQTKD